MRNEKENYTASDIKNSDRFMWSILLLAITVFFGVFGAYINRFGVTQLANRDAWGQFGDFVGGLTNPILSFLGLIILLQTFRFQLAGFRRQLSVSEKEKFESTFFRLVDRCEEYAEYLLRSQAPGLPSYAEKLRKDLIAHQKRLDALPYKEGVDQSRIFLRQVFDADTDQISSYGRKCSHCFYFVESSNLTDDEKEFYYAYIIESFHRWEFSLYLSAAFVWSPRTVDIVRENKLAKRLKPSAFASKHIYAVLIGDDITDVYPPASASDQGEAEITLPS
jgi:hypothetical protein